MILDMLKNNSDWTRPIYFAITVGQEMYMRLEPYFRQDGVAFRVLPFEAAKYQRIDPDIMYDNVINKYKYGNLDKPGLYVDENSARMATSFRVILGRLAQTLADQGDSIRAEEVADHSLKMIPSCNVPYDYYSVGDLAEVYHKIGATEKANDLFRQLADISMRNLNWYNRLNNRHYISVLSNIKRDIIYMQYIMYHFSKNNPDLFNVYAGDYANSIERYKSITEPGSTQQGGLNR
jgi:tetratricopeptide (TPR) repeat protein